MLRAGILAGTIWFALFVMGHITLFHCRPIDHRGRAIVRLFLSSAVGAVISTAVYALGGPARAADGFVAATTSVALMGSFFILYMPLYYVIAASISV